MMILSLLSLAQAAETGVIGLRMRDGTLHTVVVSTEIEPRTTHGSGVWFRHNDAFWRLNRWTIQDAVTRADRLSMQPAGALSAPIMVDAYDGALDHEGAITVHYVGGGIVSLESMSYGNYGGAHPVHGATLASVSVEGLAEGRYVRVDIGEALGPDARLALTAPDAGLSALPYPEDVGCYEASPTSWGVARHDGEWRVLGARTSTAHACPPAVFSWPLPVSAPPLAEGTLTSPGGAVSVSIDGDRLEANGSRLELPGEVEAVVAVAWGTDVDWHERLPLWP